MSATPRQILICDDEEVVREVIEAALEVGGFEPLTACNGDQALALFEANKPGIVLAIVDRRMPGMDGVEVVRRLREQQPELPILFASGAHDFASRFEGLAGRRVRPLQKPFRPSELLAAVTRELESAG